MTSDKLRCAVWLESEAWLPYLRTFFEPKTGNSGSGLLPHPPSLVTLRDSLQVAPTLWSCFRVPLFILAPISTICTAMTNRHLDMSLGQGIPLRPDQAATRRVFHSVRSIMPCCICCSIRASLRIIEFADGAFGACFEYMDGCFRGDMRSYRPHYA
jgi:hypothetical protein